MRMMRTSACHTLAGVVPVLAALACGADAPEADTATSAARVPGAGTPARESPIRMEPREGPPGTAVTLEMAGLMMTAQNLEIGFGNFVAHEIINETDSDAQGLVFTTVTVPETAEPGTYYFFIADVSGSPLAVSDSFVVTVQP